MPEESRLDKLKKLKELGIDPYPYTFLRTNDAASITHDYSKFEGKEVSVAGRAIRLRVMGGIYFADLLDGSGKIQLLARKDQLDELSIKILELADIGDILGAKGTVTKTKRGEISIDAKSIVMLSKSLSTLPEKFHGLKDTELRYRKRHLDLIMNPNVRSFFTARASILKYMRDFLDERGYTEFETPVLQHVYGGAFAKPFVTHYHALGTDAFLRISDELFLKRLIIGGFEKVYEVSKDFRNEDIDSTHNPEFTQIELYEAYKDYEDYMSLIEEMFSGMAHHVTGSKEVVYQDKKLDFSSKFKKIYWVDELKKKTGIDVSEFTEDQAKKIADEEKLATPIKNRLHVADALFDKYIKPELFQPTFIVDFPSYMCPLTKDKRGNNKLSERFEFYVAGFEEANSYSELTDPIEQRNKFSEQNSERTKGDAETPPTDYDFIDAIEYGMPPTAGLGISIDRISMILTNNTSIKEVIAFPAVRPEKKETQGI
jgi:lysyl-tRNA synthetase class 2